MMTTVALLSSMSAWSNNRLRDRDRLPMQWAVTGRVNWTAPRRIALAFTPILAAIVLSLAALRYAGRPSELGILATIAVLFVMAHLLYLWLVHKQRAG
ncbi:MAG: hypothetical protein ACXIVF_06590 [Rhizobiaceae bacterium]